MKKLEKYKIALQAKFVKFKVKRFVEIPTIRHDKAVPPLLDCLKPSSPLNVPPPAWLMTQKSSPPPSQGGADTMIWLSSCKKMTMWSRPTLHQNFLVQCCLSQICTTLTRLWTVGQHCLHCAGNCFVQCWTKTFQKLSQNFQTFLLERGDKPEKGGLM